MDRTTGERVLIVTGGLLNEKERSLVQGLRKQLLQWRKAEHSWLDVKGKAVIAEPVLASLLERRRVKRYPPELRAPVEAFFGRPDNFTTRDLTEVVLATLLRDAGIPYAIATYGDLFADPKGTARLLDETSCVFASATLLRDLSEVEPLMQMMKRPHNRIVLGGALAGLLSEDWEGMAEVDVLAVGYGELLVPALADWIRSGFRKLEAPERGRIEHRAHTAVLHSGSPETKNLDFLVTPDWALSARDHGVAHPRMVYYESVRGCPYRCAFCNYPYLFDDSVFRYRSARKIADDWEHFVRDLGVEYITCLDSLFTIPRRRLRELCEELVRRDVRVKWICYARADDLCEEDTVLLMKRAGCHQVQIGIESGHQTILDNMNKVSTVAANRGALANCRKHGLTSIVSLICGFPGETPETLEATHRLMEETPPDFYMLIPFSTRVAHVPILSAESRARFGLRTMDNRFTQAPYWDHATMTCREVGGLIRDFDRRVALGKRSLHAGVFYAGILNFRPEERPALLEFQKRAHERGAAFTGAFDRLNRWIDRRLAADMTRAFAEPGARILGPAPA